MISMYLFGLKHKLHHALGCLTLNWKSNLYGYQKTLYWSAIGINIHYQMCLPMITRTAQAIWEASIGGIDWLIGQVPVDWNNSLFEIGIYHPLCARCSATMWSILGDQQLLIIFQWYHMWVLWNSHRSYCQGAFLIYTVHSTTPCKNYACMAVIQEVIHMHNIVVENFII